MSSLAVHEAEQAAITALCESGDCDHHECQEERRLGVPQMQAITVCCCETTSPLPPVSPWPLIYTVSVADPSNEAEVRHAVTSCRMDVLDADEEDRASIYAGLELLFCFSGDLHLLTDWRG